MRTDALLKTFTFTQSQMIFIFFEILTGFHSGFGFREKFEFVITLSVFLLAILSVFFCWQQKGLETLINNLTVCLESL